VYGLSDSDSIIRSGIWRIRIEEATGLKITEGFIQETKIWPKLFGKLGLFFVSGVREQVIDNWRNVLSSCLVHLRRIPISAWQRETGHSAKVTKLARYARGSDARYSACMKTTKTGRTKSEGVATAAFRTKTGVIGELALQQDGNRTVFLVAIAGDVQEHAKWKEGTEAPLVPIAATNNLLRHGAVLLPETSAQFGTTEDLIEAIGAYLDRYVDLTSPFRVIAIHYILLSWVYDAFNELPYLRFRGEPGSGKTRALIVIGSICNRAFLASGASTVSPIFHTLDTFRGTFIFDEADFRFSDEKLELVKILNNGNVRGFPVFRSVATPQKQFNPQAFHVFGPKIVAMRHAFEDRALESRFLTEEMGQRKPRPGIPINLPDAQADEAQLLRNQLLSYRFQKLVTMQVKPKYLDLTMSARMCQILAPLLAVAEAEEARSIILEFARAAEKRHHSERGELPEVLLLSVIKTICQQGEQNIPLTLLAERFAKLVGGDYERPVTPRYIGSLVRNRLHLMPYKTGGVFILPKGEVNKALVMAEYMGVGS